MNTIKGKGKLANAIGSELPQVPPAPSFCEQIENCPEFQSLESRVSDLEQAPAGNGDMQKSVYDTNDDGVVDDADNAQNLAGQPSSYYLQNLDDVLSRGNSAGGQNITGVNELVAAIVNGVTALQILAGTNLTLSAGDTASILGPTLASILSNEGQVVIDGDRITVQHSGEVRFSASLLDMLGTTRLRNLPAAVNPDEPLRKQEHDAALANKADLVGGVIPTSQLPAIAITEFLGAVANQSAMLALLGQRGDWCIRQDQSMAYVLIAEDATQLTNWVAIPHPQSPVMSVNGQTGVIVLSTSNIGEGSNLYWTQSRFDVAFAAKTTDGLTEGMTNLYFTNARVLSTVLSGLSTATNAVITSGDTILVAIGKLQAQITANLSTLNTHTSNTSNPHNVTKAQVGLGSVPDVDATNPANINQNSFFRFVTDAEKTTWNNKQNAITQQLRMNLLTSTSQVLTTNTTAEELLLSHLIPAGTLQANDLLNLEAFIRNTSNTNTKTYRVYINTTNALAGATLIASAVVTTNAQTQKLERTIFVVNNTQIKNGVPAATSSLTGTGTAFLDTKTIPNLTANVFVLISCQKQNAADVAGLEMISLTALKNL